MTKDATQDLSRFDRIIDRYEKSEESLLAILQDFQREFHYVPEEGMRRLSEVMGVPLSKLYAMGTFYKALSLTPRGRHTIKVCTGTACHLKGAPQLLETLERELKVRRNGTTEDGEFTLECVNCVGACAMAPVVLVDEVYHGQSRPSKIVDMVKKHVGS
ncbi:NAD(P)H-dependent oxidoreductase subunit E [Candidatus Solincola tengchongensis]|uniref:NADH-quinone oxidoreductase subunit NuoE family protein n=1 Tax=Candidatus Solincola tengchongensis TaxID=2900693 RepID=UPI00257E2131|nr:NAD(P)H-dependent oxidoreductase subunit E [Candidatus Solincola tengchongensis]